MLAHDIMTTIVGQNVFRFFRLKQPTTTKVKTVLITALIITLKLRNTVINNKITLFY